MLLIRVSENEVKNNIENVIEILKFKLTNNDKVEKIKVGIVYETKKYIKKERNDKGFTKEEIKSYINQRKVERPPYEKLVEEINLLGLEGTGRKYGVTGNSIKNWLRIYNEFGF